MDTGVATVLAAGIAAGAAVVSAWLGLLAVREARLAKRNTEPVSNGFAGSVLTRLDAIHKDLGELRGDFDTYREEHNDRHEREERRSRLGRLAR